MTLGTKKVFQDLQLQGHTVYGSAASGGQLKLVSSSHGTKGKIPFGDAATSAYDEVNDRLGIGTASPGAKLHIHGSAAAATAFILADTDAPATTSGPIAYFLVDGAMPGASGHRLGQFIFAARLSGSTRQGSAIIGYAAEAWTAGSAHGSYLDVLTVPTGSITKTSRLRLQADGTMNVPIAGVFGAAVGTAPTNASTGLELVSTTKAFLPSRMTTTQRDALTAVDGMVLYNSTLAALQTRIAGAWHDVVPVAVWANWTPTIGNITGNGSITTASYIQVGKIVHFKFVYTWGSTSSISAQPSFTLPVDSTGYVSRGFAFPGVFYDLSTTTPYSAMALRSTASLVLLFQTSSSAVPTNTVPFTWATGDTIQVFGTYECV